MQELIGHDHLMLYAQTVQELSLARDLASVMKIVRTAARRLTGADGASFILQDGDNCYYADEDAISPLWKGQRFPKNACVSGWVMDHAEPAIIADIYRDERVPWEAYRPTFVKSLVIVPIRRMSPIGAIGVYWGVENSPTDPEVKLLQALADITSVTLENIKVHDELENRVKERTVELEKKNNDLEILSYSLSHDLRSPLRLIRLLTSQLKDKHISDKSPEANEVAEKILLKTRTMNDLIKSLLLFFSQDIQKSNVSMQAIVTEACADCKEELKLPVEIVTHPLPNVEGDSALLKQVWINLLSNAIKFSSKAESPRVEIGCQDAKGGTVFFVKDNGTGFSAEHKERLFKARERLHSSQEFEGHGLGLAIVDRIISKHGGHVWAESEPNNGAAFYFFLPI